MAASQDFTRGHSGAPADFGGSEDPRAPEEVFGRSGLREGDRAERGRGDIGTFEMTASSGSSSSESLYSCSISLADLRGRGFGGLVTGSVGSMGEVESLGGVLGLAMEGADEEVDWDCRGEGILLVERLWELFGFNEGVLMGKRFCSFKLRT